MSKVRQQYERQLQDLNKELSDQRSKYTELQKKYDVQGMELTAAREASDKSQNDKLKEIERLKLVVEELNETIEQLRSASKNQMGELERQLQDKIERYEKEKRVMLLTHEQVLQDVSVRHQEELDRQKKDLDEQLTQLQDRMKSSEGQLRDEYEKRIQVFVCVLCMYSNS